MRTIRMPIVLLLVLSAFTGACGSSARERPVTAAPSQPSQPSRPSRPSQPPPDAHASAAGDDADFRADRDPALTPPDQPTHERAIAAVAAGRLYEAKRLLARLVIAYPDHEILLAQYNAVVARLKRAQSVAKASLEGTLLRTLPAPPVKYTLARAARAGDTARPKLVKASERRNGITDAEAWFGSVGGVTEFWVPPEHDVIFAPGAVGGELVVHTFSGFVYTEHRPSARFAPGDLPLMIPLAYGTMPLTRAIDSAPYIVAVYGQRIVAVFETSGTVRALLDFAQYIHPEASKKGEVVVGEATLTTSAGTQRGEITMATESVTHHISFALARDATLFVEHTNLGYARDNQGQNAYLTAIDLDTGELAWRSDSLVANGNNFTLVRGAVVCGYGFSAEPDFVYVLDAATGAPWQKIRTRSSPENFVQKDGRLHVRAYDTDYVFDLR